MTVTKDSEGSEARYLRRYADLGTRHVLEVGCGDGRLTWRYADAVCRVTGIDLDRNELRVAYIERPPDLEKIVSLAQADSIHLPFRNHEFDLAILAWSF
jgi:ubiquinone/menaquinone biosynthesis C-methylase UbiE